MNLTASERAWFYWALAFVLILGFVIGLGTAEWALIP